MHNAAIEVTQLTRTFTGAKGPVTALDGISFTVREGAIHGVLGPNGAGKTTCVRIISTLLTPSSGSVRVAGIDVVTAPRRAQRVLGVSFGGDLGLYTRVSARENLLFFGTMYGLSGGDLRKRVDELLSQVGLRDRARDRVEGFSRGMRQRLHLARALLHDPPVLLLDEPSAGLDPQAARQLRETVGGLAAEGRTVLLTTHDMREAEELCESVMLFNKGTIVRNESPRLIREAVAQAMGWIVEATYAGPVPDDATAGISGVIEGDRDAGVLRIVSATPAETMNRLLAAPTPPRTCNVSSPSLEESYIHLVEADG
jgi:ABC-2 type transport system ATP-binding protein